jgi:hypothetical protein
MFEIHERRRGDSIPVSVAGQVAVASTLHGSSLARRGSSNGAAPFVGFGLDCVVGVMLTWKTTRPYQPPSDRG